MLTSIVGQNGFSIIVTLLKKFTVFLKRKNFVVSVLLWPSIYYVSSAIDLAVKDVFTFMRDLVPTDIISDFSVL